MLSRDRTKEFRSALQLELRRVGREGDVNADPVIIESETLSRASSITKKLSEIESLVRRLDALVGLRGETSVSQSQFELVMESVADDCKWVDRELQRATDAAKLEVGQRRDFEHQIALTLRKQLEQQAKKVQNCADLRQKTLQEQQQRRNRLSRAGQAISASVQLDTPLFKTYAPPNSPPQPEPPRPPYQALPPPSFSSGLRSRRTAASVIESPHPTNSRLQLEHRQRQQQQQFLLEQTSRRRLDHAHTIESEIGKLGELFSRFSSLVAQQAEVVERLDDDVESARAEVEAGHKELTSAQAIILGNRSLLIKIFGLILIFIVLFVGRG